MRLTFLSLLLHTYTCISKAFHLFMSGLKMQFIFREHCLLFIQLLIIPKAKGVSLMLCINKALCGIFYLNAVFLFVMIIYVEKKCYLPVFFFFGTVRLTYLEMRCMKVTSGKRRRHFSQGTKLCKYNLQALLFTTF